MGGGDTNGAIDSARNGGLVMLHSLRHGVLTPKVSRGVDGEVTQTRFRSLV